MKKMKTSNSKLLKMDVIYYCKELSNEERVNILFDVAKRDAKEKSCELNKVIVIDSMEDFEKEMDHSFSDKSVDYVILFNVEEMEKNLFQMKHE